MKVDDLARMLSVFTHQATGAEFGDFVWSLSLKAMTRVSATSRFRRGFAGALARKTFIPRAAEPEEDESKFLEKMFGRPKQESQVSGGAPAPAPISPAQSKRNRQKGGL
jgi:hypothetical protein